MIIVVAAASLLLGRQLSDARPPVESSDSEASPQEVRSPLPSSDVAADPGLWIGRRALKALPTSGPAWQRLVDTPAGRLRDISCQDSEHAAGAMARALVAARLDDPAGKASVRDAILAVVGTEAGSTCGHQPENRVLGLGRNLVSYVIAADVIDLSAFDPAADGRFRTWLGAVRTVPPTESVPNSTLTWLDEHDPGNWSGYAGASRASASLYIGDAADVARSADALRRFTGDGAGFEWRPTWDLSWACDPDRPVPINPPCGRDGHELGGIVVADMRRGDGYRWPPTYTQYPRETLVGRSVQAQLLARAGYPAFEFGDRGLYRAAARLIALDELDDRWYEPEMNAYWLIAGNLGGLPTGDQAIGRSVVGADWTHARPP